MRMAARGATAVAAAATAIAMLAGCGGSGSHKASPAAATAGASSTNGGLAASADSGSTSSAPASPTTSPAVPLTAPITTSSTRLSPALLAVSDLPAGFREHALTARNLPSLIHGCPGLETLQQTGINDMAQGEWAQGGLLDPYIDEAVMEPRGTSAAQLVADSAKALNACGSVDVVEEGHSVTLTATPLTLAKAGDASYAWHTTGRYAGIPMELNVALVQQGDLVVLIAQTRIGGHADQALTSQAAQAGAARAAAFQKLNP